MLLDDIMDVIEDCITSSCTSRLFRGISSSAVPLSHLAVLARSKFTNFVQSSKMGTVTEGFDARLA